MRHELQMFSISVLLILGSYSNAQAGQLVMGAIETSLISNAPTRPKNITEIRNLQSAKYGQATMSALAAPVDTGELRVVTDALPSNALLNRVTRTRWTVFAYEYDTGLVVPNVSYTLLPLRHKPNSGGHDHDSNSRPKGELSKYSGNTGPTGYDTDIEYISPEVSGTVYTDGSCTGPNGFACFPGYYYSFTTKVSGLVELSADLTYDLIGSTSSHSSNHWGTSSFIGKLQNAASLYYLRYDGMPQPKLAINDISLETGGLFDVGANWATPHREHRIGVVGDLRVVPVARIAALKKILLDAGIVGPVLIHSPPDTPHWHIREYNSHE